MYKGGVGVNGNNSWESWWDEEQVFFFPFSFFMHSAYRYILILFSFFATLLPVHCFFFLNFFFLLEIIIGTYSDTQGTHTGDYIESPLLNFPVWNCL